MSEIKAIETEYDGHRFRSRTEARWAVFFNNANIKYTYETEGFENKEGARYLPDFYLPDFDVHVEVKPNPESHYNGFMKSKSFIVWGGPIKALVYLCDIPNKVYNGKWYFPSIRYSVGFGKDLCQEASWFIFYDNVDKVTGHIARDVHQAPFHRKGDKIVGVKTNNGYEKFSLNPLHESCFPNKVKLEEYPLLYYALDKARQARFEYGENG